MPVTFFVNLPLMQVIVIFFVEFTCAVAIAELTDNS
jgi:hypothetical protein